MSIDKRLIKDLGDRLLLGQEENFQHTACSAGFDKKRRLYIKRVTGGLLAYCHHCSEHGYVGERNTDGTHLRRWLANKTDELPKVYRINGTVLHTDVISNVNIISWLWDHFIDVNASRHSHLKQIGSHDLYLPLNDFQGRKYGYQLRSFNPKPKNKYLTYLMQHVDDSCSWFLSSGTPSSPDKLFITEDYISAYRIFCDTGNSSMALLRTSMSTSTELDITTLSKIKKIVVWLDPDEAGRKGADKIQDRLHFLTSIPVVNCRYAYEPKVVSPEKLRLDCDGL